MCFTFDGFIRFYFKNLLTFLANNTELNVQTDRRKFQQGCVGYRARCRGGEATTSIQVGVGLGAWFREYEESINEHEELIDKSCEGFRRHQGMRLNVAESSSGMSQEESINNEGTQFGSQQSTLAPESEARCSALTRAKAKLACGEASSAVFFARKQFGPPRMTHAGVGDDLVLGTLVAMTVVQKEHVKETLSDN